MGVTPYSPTEDPRNIRLGRCAGVCSSWRQAGTVVGVLGQNAGICSLVASIVILPSSTQESLTNPYSSLSTCTCGSPQCTSPVDTDCTESLGAPIYLSCAPMYLRCWSGCWQCCITRRKSAWSSFQTTLRRSTSFRLENRALVSVPILAHLTECTGETDFAGNTGCDRQMSFGTTHPVIGTTHPVNPQL